MGTYAGNIVLDGDQPAIKVVFNNEGNTVASNIQATLSTDNSNISINGNSGSDVVSYNSMAIGSSKTATYNIGNLNSINETQTIPFNFTLACGTTSTSCSIMLTYIKGNNPGPPRHRIGRYSKRHTSRLPQPQQRPSPHPVQLCH